MTADIFYKLDNPAWYALTETHQHFALGDDKIKRYGKNIAPFVSLRPGLQDLFTQLDRWVSPGESFFIIGNLPDLPIDYTLESGLNCVQMICNESINIPGNDIIEELGEVNDEEMITLINLVQPGYYNPGTRWMGDYYGIRCNGQLVSMAGERMRMNGLTEISAVVTHPQFTGRGYAKQLIAHVVNKNLSVGTIPFLHVAATNQRAIKLYEHLCFIQRRPITFWKIKRN